MSRISVGITTRNRPASLARCLRSLSLAADLIADVLVFDDASAPPAADAMPIDIRHAVTVLRDDSAPGGIVGRNRLVERAAQPLVLLLDDDAYLLTRESVVSAIGVLESDRSVGAVAFAQAEADSKPWPPAMQPSRATAPARVRAFIGFAHLVRRDVFRALSGYREMFVFYGEEKEYTLRLLEAGLSVVYLPDALVAHVPDPAGRDPRRYLRCVSRNDCLNALLNDPWWRLAWMLPARLALYLRMRRGWRVRDPGGFRWIVAELLRAAPRVARERKPVSRRTLRRWRTLGLSGEPYGATTHSIVI
jgi:GT2 family glycosyltransferase